MNLPNWLPLRFRARSPGSPPGPWFSSDDGSLPAYRQVLDLYGGTSTRSFRLRDGDGRHPTRVHTGTADGGTVWLRCRTTTSHSIRIVAADQAVTVTPGETCRLDLR